MREDLQQPEQQPEVDINTLAEAKARIESGTASDEDKAMVAGFEAGAAAAHELRSAEERTTVANLLEPTEKRIDDLQATVDTEKAWGEDTTQLETTLQGHKDMRDYLESRDYTDVNGSIHDAESGKFASKDNANGGETDKTDSIFETTKDATDEYASLSIDELVTKWAEAEDNNDKTTSLNVQDILQERLLNERQNAEQLDVPDDYEGTKGLSDEHAVKLIDRMHDMMMARRKNSQPQEPEIAVPDQTDELDNETLHHDKAVSIDHDDTDDQGVAIEVRTKKSDGVASTTAAPKSEQLAIEVVPVRPAIEAAPEKKAIEAAPAEEEPLPELSYQVGMVKNSLKHVAEAAVDRIEAEKEAMASMGRMRRFFNGLKFSTLFKRETERKRAQEIMEPLTEVIREDGVFGVAEYLGRIHGRGIADARAQERAMLEVLLDDELQRAGDVVIDGQNGEDNPLVAEIRSRSKEILLTYLDESSAEGITDDERAELVAVYEWDMQQLVKDMLEAHPEQFNTEAFAAMADSSLELMEQSRLYLRHEDGRQQLEAMLDSMKISVGQIQVGPNSSYDTKYIEGTIDQLRNRRVGSVVGRVSFVAGTWATGALAAGALEQMSQSVTTSGARYGAAAVGGVLLGPVGAVAGYGAGVAASAFWGRHLARKRAMETVSMMEVKSGDAGAIEKTELFKLLAQDTVSYRDTTANFGRFLVTDSETPRLRTDLSSQELQDLIGGLSEVSVRLGVERATNTVAQTNAGEQEINLFMATDASAAQTERNELIKLSQELRAQLEEAYGESGVQIGDETVVLGQIMAVAEAASATGLMERMRQVAERRDTFIRQQGRRGALIAGSISGVFGIAGAAAAEAFTNGGASTVLDTVGVRPDSSGNAIVGQFQSVKIGNVTAQFNSANGSQVHLLAGGKQLEVTTPNGTQQTFTLDSHGHLSAADTDTLKSEGIIATSKTVKAGTSTRIVGTSDFLQKHGGRPMEVGNWEMNGTEKPDGTELGAHIVHAKNGDWVISQDQGTAFGSGKSYDMLAQAQKGELYAYITNKGMSVPLKMQVTPNGHIEVHIPKNSPLHTMFYTKQGGHIQFKGSMWRIGVPTGKNTYDSIASMHGDGLPKMKATVPVNGSVIKLQFASEAEPTGFTIPGFAFSGDHGRLYGAETEKPKDDEPQQSEGPTQATGASESSGPDVTQGGVENRALEPTERPAAVEAASSSQESQTAGEDVVRSGESFTTDATYELTVYNGKKPLKFIRKEGDSYLFEDLEQGGTITYGPNQMDGPVGWIESGRIRRVNSASVSNQEQRQTTELESSEPKLELEPAPPRALEQQEVLRNAVQAQPLSPNEIIERLTNSVPTGLKVEISGQVLDAERVALTGGAPRLIMRKADGTEDFIELENFRQAIEDGKVRFNKYLGTPDATAIVDDIRVGEVFSDDEYGTIRITRVNDASNGFAFEQLDESGEPILREADSNPRAFTPAAFKARIEQGITTPNSYRGVQIA